MSGPADELIAVRDLRIRFASGRGDITAVDGVSFTIARGETLALVGESGSGKSTTALALMGLVESEGGVAVEGVIDLRLKDGSRRDINRLKPGELRRVRGREIAMIFQEPMSSLNPVYTIETQIAEALRLHQGMTESAARRRALELLDLLSIANPEGCLAGYPHQLSGGMRQRVMIAIALSCEPNLLIADEPTTALDVTIQAQILELLKDLQQRTGMAMLFITHNFGVVAEIAHRTMVMYAGRVVEAGDVDEVFHRPRMPYTQALLRSLPRLGRKRERGARLEAIPGNMPSVQDWPSGCAFHPRCAYALPDVCDAREPSLEPCAPGHVVSCLRWAQLMERSA